MLVLPNVLELVAVVVLVLVVVVKRSATVVYALVVTLLLDGVSEFMFILISTYVVVLVLVVVFGFVFTLVLVMSVDDGGYFTPPSVLYSDFSYSINVFVSIIKLLFSSFLGSSDCGMSP